MDTNGTGCADWGEVDTNDVKIEEKLTLMMCRLESSGR